MPNDEEMQTGQNYAQTILSKWLEIVELGEKIRVNIMSGNHDSDDLHVYISKLTRIWLELKPKVVGRKFTNSQNLETDFLSFQKYYYDPQQLIKSEGADAETIFKLEECIRMVLEELHVTEW